MPRLEDRRKGGDMIVYKIVIILYEMDKEEFLKPVTARPRGHRFELRKKHAEEIYESSFFASIVGKGWNNFKLSGGCLNICSFKVLYDKRLKRGKTISIAFIL